MDLSFTFTLENIIKVENKEELLFSIFKPKENLEINKIWKGKYYKKKDMNCIFKLDEKQKIFCKMFKDGIHKHCTTFRNSTW